MMSGNRAKKRNIKKPAIITAASAGVLLCIFLAAGMFMPKNKIANNVFSKNVNLSGMTLAEANEALENADYFEGIEFEVVSGGFSEKFKAEDIALAADAKKTAEKAYKIGKSKNPFKNSADFFRLIFSKKDIGCVPEADSDALDSLLYNLGVRFNGEFTDYRVEPSDGKVTIFPRVEGQDPNTEAARNQVLASIENGIYTGIAVILEKSKATTITADELYEMVHSEPQNAEYVYEGNEISIKEHSVGIDVNKADMEGAASLLNSGRQAEVPAKTIIPQATANQLKSKLFNSTLAAYSTTYSTKAANRASNVALAASKINGKVLKPGETFSYNETIGDTTIKNGYKVAPVFENGKTSEGVGGGICQVSSTLYSAVLYADLKVVERRNHSLTVAYVPKGQDATVSYGAIDFKFKNSTDYPIKISAVTDGGKITVSLVGTKREAEHKVQLRHEIVSTIQPTTVETQNPDMPANTKKVTSSGKTGYVVDTYKTVFENGTEISSGKITRSTYKMVPTEVTVGTKQEAPVYVVPSPAPTDNPPAQSEAPAEEIPGEIIE